MRQAGSLIKGFIGALLLALSVGTAAVGTAAAQGGTPLVAFVNSAGQVIVSSGDGGFRWIVTNPGEQLAASPVWSSDGSRLLFGIQAGAGVSIRVGQVSTQQVSDVAQIDGSLSGLSPSGRYALITASGSYAIADLSSGAVTPLPVNADQSGGLPLWTDDGSLVAYWGYQNGSTVLGVTNASNGATLIAPNAFSTPVIPLAWQPGGSALLYRDANGVEYGDVSCLLGGCSGALQGAQAVLPASVTNLQADRSNVYFADGSLIAAAPFGCGGVCVDSAVAVAADASSAKFNVAGSRLAYTSSAQSAAAVDLSCLSSGSCQPVTVSGSTAGPVSGDGRYVVVQQNGGLAAVDLLTGASAYLSDGGKADAATWN